MKDKLISVLIFSLFLNCASINENKVIGTYKNTNKIGSTYLKFYTDKTFEFNCQIPMIQSKSIGNWSINKNKLFLKSYESFKNNYLNVQEKLNTDERTIYLVDINNYPIEGASVIINSNIIYETNKNGKIDLTLIKEKLINKIEIMYIDILEKQGVYNTINSKSVSYYIKLIPKEYGKEYFDNEELKIRGNKIFYKNQFYKKVSLY